MAEAALVEEMQVPKGGIADFVMSDEDIEAVYGPDDDGAEEYGTEGLGQFTEVANQMAAKGRYGDDMVAHVESGELVIPKEFLDRDPELKRSLFKYLEDHGIENPERYVVGSDANSLNPDTGMPEFFFKKVKKAFKKVAKTVSKVAKPVIKVIQKLAPTVLPIALSMTPLGPVFGAALGSGIASLINGGSIKDAFKSALISGAMGAAYAGVGGMVSGQGFMAGVGEAVSSPMARFSQTLTGAQNSLTRLAGGEVAANAPGFFSDFVSNADLMVQDLSTPDVFPPSQPASSAQAYQAAQQTAGPTSSMGTYEGFQAGSKFGPGQNTFDPTEFADNAFYNVNMPQPLTLTNFQAPELTDVAQASGLGQFGGGATQTLPGQERTTLQTVGDYMFRGGQSPEQIAKTANLAKQSAIQQSLESSATAGLSKTDPTVIKTALTAGQKAFEAAQPGLLAKYGPTAALGLGAAYAAGAFDTPETETPGLIPTETGEDRLKENPEDYMVADLGYQRFNPETGQYETVQNPYPNLDSYVSPTQYTYNLAPRLRPAGGPFSRPDIYPLPPNIMYQTAADGGPIFPRRNGGIMPDEGVPGKDSVRAMLMPGEFVMTTDAVRGAGGGNLNRGINNMYTVMRNLESRGRRIA